jgi:anti-sigma regulatory factor (Ser/Thr protein kinase)
LSTPEGLSLTEAFVDLSDRLVADYDVLEFLHLLATRCVDLLGVQAAGIMIGDQRGALRVMASSSEQAHLLKLFEVETNEGPCVDCYASGVPVDAPDLATVDPRWQRFAGEALGAGFHAAYAVPVRLRDEVIGVLNLFAVDPGPLDDTAARTARALANITTIGLLQHRAVEYRQILAEQLQLTMNSRVVIEQAKGIIAERLDLDMAESFDELSRLAARIGGQLADVASAVTAGDFAPAMIERDVALRIVLIRRFRVDTLGKLRSAIGAAASRHGLSENQAWQFVLAVHEAAVNAVRHGGGQGRLVLWKQHGALVAEISDQGSGIQSVPAASGGGRGLWLIKRICPGLDVETGPSGTRLTLPYPIDSPVVGPVVG